MNDKNYQLIAFTEDGLSLDVRVDAEKETVWLTQAEMAELFGIERPVVLYHLRPIYRNEELSEEATCTKIVQAQNEGGRAVKRERPIYNLDAEKETVWLTQAEMAKLFGVERTRITRHLSNIYKDGELDKSATCAESAQVQNESNVRKTHFANANRPTALYGLDMILAIGYRVNSKRGIAFRS